jgi:hypothetical protein
MCSQQFERIPKVLKSLSHALWLWTFWQGRERTRTRTRFSLLPLFIVVIDSSCLVKSPQRYPSISTKEPTAYN